MVAGDKFETLGRGTPVQPAGVPAGISCAAYKHTIAKGGKAEVRLAVSRALPGSLALPALSGRGVMQAA